LGHQLVLDGCSYLCFIFFAKDTGLGHLAQIVCFLVEYFSLKSPFVIEAFSHRASVIIYNR